MTEPHDPNVTADILASSVPPDSLDAGLAAGFGRRVASPRSQFTTTLARPVLLKDAEGESAHIVKPKSDAMPPKEETGDRYQLSGEIARGGMGAVLRGRDVDLGRDLAVKVLLEKYANRPEVARRFIEEAQIGGQLQHPGVVPVYDIGRFGDRPFFTMKLVKGQTLAAVLEERADAATDRPRLIGIALKIAETLAYAHAKGVIHRDLKPANVMVGAFGEVQVMDWGLAKVLAEGGIADEERASRAHQEPDDVTHIRTARSTGSASRYGTDTEAGSLLGTPAYMPPEQANGDIAHLDRRADVFGLGAILCEILTGRPPYVGRSGEEVRRKAANGDLADATARLDGCEADAELIALTKKCLSPEAIDRPKDAQEVTDRLSAYLNGVQERLQVAEQERAVALARAEEEAKTRQVAEEKAAEQRKRRRVQAQLAASVAVLLLGGVAVAWWQTEQAGARRETDLRRQLEDEQRLAADNARFGRTAEAVTALLGQCEEALRANDAAKAAVALDAARKRSAEGGAAEQAPRLGRLDADLALLRDLDAIDQFRWTLDENRYPDPAVVATRTREALTRFGTDPDAMSADDAAARVSASVVREPVVMALDRLLRQQKTAGVRAVLRRVDADPYRDAVRDAVLANDQAKFAELAGQPAALSQPPGFAAFLGGSTAIDVKRRRQLLGAAVSRRPGDLNLLMTLGETYPPNQKDTATEQLRWAQAAVAAAPANCAAHNNLGVALIAKGQVDEAITCWRKAIQLNPNDRSAYSNLGAALRAKGQVDEAIACFHKALALDPNHARIYSNMGIALSDRRQFDEAITWYRKANALEPNFAMAHYNLGIALKDKGQVDEAITCYQKAIELDPNYANAYHNLGGALNAKGQADKAIACYQKAIELDKKSPQFHNSLGIALRANGQLNEAILCFRMAIELEPTRAACHANLGLTLKDKGQMDEAIACCRKAIELDEKLTGAYITLGTGLVRKGQMDEAIACCRKAIELDPNYAMAHYNLACYSALAAGQSENVARRDDKERVRFRRQALDSLRDALALYAKQLERARPIDRATVQQKLLHWQKDPDLASLRDAAALAKLPADEQKAFTQLWADVAALLKTAEGKANPAPPAAKPPEPNRELPPAAGEDVTERCSVQYGRHVVCARRLAGASGKRSLRSAPTDRAASWSSTSRR